MSTDRAPHRAPHFRPDVEGLRAVAVVSVVLYHCGVGATPGGFVGVDVFFVLSGFLITGLLWREMRTAGRISLLSFYARRARRLLPAAVLVLLVTATAAIALLPAVSARSVLRDVAAAAVYGANVRFAVVGSDYLDAVASPSPVQHYWSLGVEEQFYFVWPIVLIAAAVAARRLKVRPVAAAAVALASVLALSFTVSLLLTRTATTWAFFSLHTRAWELAIGGLVALAAPRLGRLPGRPAAVVGWLGMLLIGWGVVRFGTTTPFPGTAALFPVLGTAAVLVVGCTSPPGGPHRLLSIPPLQRIGAISYGWYLWHWPLLILVPVAVGRVLPLWQRLAVALAGAVLAGLTLRFVENPVRFGVRFRLPAARVVRLAATTTAGLTTLALVAGFALPQTRGSGDATLAALPGLAPEAGAAAAAQAPEASADAAPAGAGTADAGTASAGTATAAALGTAPAAPSNSPAEAAVAAAVRKAVTVKAVPANLSPSLERARKDRARTFVDGCHNEFVQTALKRCVYGDPAGSRTIMLVGDSHAAHWFPTLERIATARRWKLVSLTKSTCPAVSMSIYSPFLRRAYRECDVWRTNVLARIRAEKPAVVVLSAARHYNHEYRFKVYGPQWVSGLGDMVKKVRATGAPTVVLGPVAKPAMIVPDCVANNLRNALGCGPPVGLAINRTGVRAESAAVARAGGTYVDVTPWMCGPKMCPVIIGNLLVYRDDNHISTTYAAWLAPVMAGRLDAARR